MLHTFSSNEVINILQNTNFASIFVLQAGQLHRLCDMCTLAKATTTKHKLKKDVDKNEESKEDRSQP